MTAAYWEGYQSFTTQRACPYQAGNERADWANGFAAAVSESKQAKVWWRSKTMRVSVVLLFGAIVLLSAGRDATGTLQTSTALTAAGGFLTGREILGIMLRAVTDQPISIN